VQDLELDTLFNAMAAEDEFLFKVAKHEILSGQKNELETILYRQAILKDCLRNAQIVREMYDLAVETIDNERKNYWSILRDYPDVILHRSVEVLGMFMNQLKKLRGYADQYQGQFESDGFLRLFSMLQQELNDVYFEQVQNHLNTLKFRGGVLVSAELGKGNKGIHYMLRRPHKKKQSIRDRLFAPKPPEYSFTLADRDEAGMRALTQLKDRGLNLVANAMAQSNDHILSFFKLLRTELAFYTGCLNMHEKLVQKGEPVGFPEPQTGRECRLSFDGLYDVSLSLTMTDCVVGNDLRADDKNLVIITGANQGGKSTFLRSIGQAQLMMQSGMFAPAQAFQANLIDGLFTHFKREEDTTMSSGKLDEELSRMSDIADHITANPMLLFNESFAATNEREGSEIARQIVTALMEKNYKVFFVTHLYEFARRLYESHFERAMFLRAERQPDGTRTFKILEGKPLETSYGEDLYEKIFVGDQHPSP
jgi:DNA mismatch repair ATPase MutS